jgi:hypothetical protein
MRARWKDDVLTTDYEGRSSEELQDATQLGKRVINRIAEEFQKPPQQSDGMRIVKEFPPQRFIRANEEAAEITKLMDPAWFGWSRELTLLTLTLRPNVLQRKLPAEALPILRKVVKKWNAAYAKSKSEIDQAHRRRGIILSGPLDESTMRVHFRLRRENDQVKASLLLAGANGEVLVCEEANVDLRSCTTPLPEWAQSEKFQEPLVFKGRLRQYLDFIDQSNGGGVQIEADESIRKEMADPLVHDPTAWSMISVLEDQARAEERPIFAWVPDDCLVYTELLSGSRRFQRSKGAPTLRSIIEEWNGFVLNWERGSSATFVRPVRATYPSNEHYSRECLAMLYAEYVKRRKPTAKLAETLHRPTPWPLFDQAIFAGSTAYDLLPNIPLIPLTQIQRNFKGRFMDLPPAMTNGLRTIKGRKLDPLSETAEWAVLRDRGPLNWLDAEISERQWTQWPPETQVEINVSRRASWYAAGWKIKNGVSGDPTEKVPCTKVTISVEMTSPDGWYANETVELVLP